MQLRKPVRRSLSRQALETMEEMIRGGQWKVGDRIPSEPELARSLSVSHNTIREALQSLIHAGMLEARPGDGTYVTASDRFSVVVGNRLKEAELPKILEARLALEREIARLAAANRTASDLASLRSALAKCRERSGGGIADDMAFHARVAEAAHNSILAEFYQVIISTVTENLEFLLREKQYDPGAMALHDRLYEAIETRNPSLAEEMVAAIVRFDTESIAELLPERCQTPPQNAFFP
ncbi:MAG: FadR family transcriptional regulator [Akkermansia sp.]|nr:FadR family transcriptional regulator [Akkermansia sp.]MCD8070815.1 FadR family transcriptional regulator [Akkermansiaceae bacterium]